MLAQKVIYKGDQEQVYTQSEYIIIGSYKNCFKSFIKSAMQKTVQGKKSRGAGIDEITWEKKKKVQKKK
jgi:hypothetical protein